MRGPFWNAKTGVTGEKNYETYRDDEGVLRTRILDRREEEDVD